MPALPTYPAARDRLLALISPLPEQAQELRHAHGHTLRQPVCLQRDQPPFDRATMDGFAIASQPGRADYRVVGHAQAGASATQDPQPGEAISIATGSSTPPNTAVVPIECCTVTTADDGRAETVSVSAADLKSGLLNIGRNVAKRGEDGQSGEAVVAAGSRLGPLAIAAAAMAGANTVTVSREPRVAIIITGDEVGRSDDDGIADSNSPLLAGLLAGLGIKAQIFRAIDEPEATRQALEQAASDRDLVITTGGVSVGPRDLIRPCAEQLGWEVAVHGIAIQPGKPVLIAQRRGTAAQPGPLLLGLPGNPVSVLATFHLFAWPAIAALRGGQQPSWQQHPAAAAIGNHKKRHIFLPGIVDHCGARGVPWHGSGDLIAAATANCLLDLPIGQDFAVGDTIRTLPLISSAADQCAQLPASRSTTP